MYFKNELEYSKGSDHVTDDIVPLFWSLQKLSRKNITMYFPTNFHCHVIKRPLSTALGLHFFAHVHCPVKF